MENRERNYALCTKTISDNVTVFTEFEKSKAVLQSVKIIICDTKMFF